MASTRELAGYVLKNDPQLRQWFEAEHGFTVEKAVNGDFDCYRDLISAVIREGVHSRTISQAQADGREAL